MSDHGDKGVVSFAVFENTGGGSFVTALNTLLGTSLSASQIPGASAIDATARFIYLYQVRNTASSTPVIEDLKITDTSPGGSRFTSVGFLSKQVFVDSQGNVGVGSNTGLGTNPSADDPLDGNPSFKNQTLNGFATVAGSINPSGTDFDEGGSGDGFVTISFNEPTIRGGQTSSVVFLTSRFPPGYAEGGIQDGTRSDGDIPTAITPEPGSLVLCGLGVSFLGFYGWRRRGLKAQPAVA